jgi:hypothetical protein
MSNLIAAPAVLGTLAVFAIACWWLPNLALVGRAGFYETASLSSGVAAVAVLTQYLVIALLANVLDNSDDFVPTSTNRMAGTLNRCWSMLGAVMVFWPLLLMLWLTSRLSAAVLVTTQIVAIAIAALIALAATTIASLQLARENRVLLSSTVAIAMAAIIWLNRTRIIDGIGA